MGLVNYLNIFVECCRLVASVGMHASLLEVVHVHNIRQLSKWKLFKQYCLIEMYLVALHIGYYTMQYLPKVHVFDKLKGYNWIYSSHCMTFRSLPVFWDSSTRALIFF